jgi:1-deoxy-D-xylulose-5-phosphate synthase
MKPFCNIYSSFSHRAFDQIFHDVALQGLPVVLCLDRSGIVGEDGATHHGCYDMAVYRTLPGTIIAAPKDETELKNMMYSASLAKEGPFIIRYPRGYGEGTEWKTSGFEVMEPGKGELMMEGTDIAVIAAGPSANRALEAAVKIKEQTGWNPSIYNIRYIKPLDEEMMRTISGTYGKVITIEDGCIMGGLYGAVTEFISATETPIPVKAVGIPDRYISQGTQEELKEECRLTTDEIFAIFTEEKEKICKKD